MLSLIPRPVSLVEKEGAFLLTRETAIAADSALEPVAGQLAETLGRATGFAFERKTASAANVISLQIDDTLLRDESYRFEVRDECVDLKSASAAGAFRGIQTLLQLLPPAVFSHGPRGNIEWRIPCVSIEDHPRFAWRGAMLDCARHFMPKAFVKKLIDLLALHKLNRFHWHLTDDQGWRIEIKKYPKLTGIGAWRRETMRGHFAANAGGDGIPHGGFYSQDDIREIVAFAAARHIEIVPEIDMPGHMQAAIAAYPELGCTGEKIEVNTGWGIHENILNANETTIAFMQNVLAEVMELFPGKFIHIGGDEAVKTQWNAHMQSRMRELGVRDADELQSWFIRRMGEFLASHNRRLVGWDEILEGGLAPGATVMSWRGSKGGIAAARAGHDVVMTPNTHTYFDYYQSREIENEPLAIGSFLPLEKAYDFEPIPSGFSADEAAHVLGIQGQLWTEYMPNPRHVEYMAFPRLCALGEVAWSEPEKNYADFCARLRRHLKRLDLLGVKYRPLD